MRRNKHEVLTLYLVLVIILLSALSRVWMIMMDSPMYTNSKRGEECQVFQGKWEYDNSSHPLYQPSSCPIVEQGFRCMENGRSDGSYMKWRWQPFNCDIPRFDAEEMLKRYWGRRIVFVGDSMARTQWESLICMLLEGVENDDKHSVYEVNKNNITKLRRYLAYKFSKHNLTVEYYRSPFLVQQRQLISHRHRHLPKRVHSTIQLDKLDSAEIEWRNAHVLIFNTGHWWNPSKTYQSGCYFQIGASVKLGMKIDVAYQHALKTWASWVDDYVDTNITKVIFRSFEPSHWDRSKKQCLSSHINDNNNKSNTNEHPQTQLVHQVIKDMNKSVTVLNITSLSDTRSDGHIATWNKGPPPLDCSHWCLPGIPDTWNELLYMFLLPK